MLAPGEVVWQHREDVLINRPHCLVVHPKCMALCPPQTQAPIAPFGLGPELGLGQEPFHLISVNWRPFVYFGAAGWHSAALGLNGLARVQLGLVWLSCIQLYPPGASASDF